MNTIVKILKVGEENNSLNYVRYYTEPGMVLFMRSLDLNVLTEAVLRVLDFQMM